MRMENREKKMDNRFELRTMESVHSVHYPAQFDHFTIAWTGQDLWFPTANTGPSVSFLSSVHLFSKSMDQHNTTQHKPCH